MFSRLAQNWLFHIKPIVSFYSFSALDFTHLATMENEEERGKPSLERNTNT